MLKSKHSVLGSMEGTDARISRRQRRLPQMGNTGTDYNVIGNEIHSPKEERYQLQLASPNLINQRYNGILDF